MNDSDQSSITSSESSTSDDEVEEEDYATQVARRRQEELSWQQHTEGKLEAIKKEIKANPYEMLPARYKQNDCIENKISLTSTSKPKDDKQTLLVPLPLVEPLKCQEDEHLEEEEEIDIPSDDSATSDIGDVNFDPKVLADIVQKDFKIPTDTSYDMFELATSVLEETIEADIHFRNLQNRFKAKYASQFTDEEENKLEFYTIFQSWIRKLDTYLTKKLSIVPSFDIEEFIATMEERKDEVSPDLWNLILSFTDYQIFKDTMLEYKANGPDADSILQKELFDAIAVGDKVMTKHFEEAQKSKDAMLAEKAVARGLEKLMMPPSPTNSD